MEKSGFVVEVKGDIAHISVLRPSECGDKCSNCSGSCNEQSMVVQVSNTLSAQVGDQVALSMQSAHLIKLSFLLYTVPLIAFVLGVLIGYSQATAHGISGDFVALGAGFASMLIAYFGINFWLRHNAKTSETILTMVKLYRQGDLINLH